MNCSPDGQEGGLGSLPRLRLCQGGAAEHQERHPQHVVCGLKALRQRLFPASGEG